MVSSVASGFNPPTKIFLTGSFFMAIAFLGSMGRPSSLCSFCSSTCRHTRHHNQHLECFIFVLEIIILCTLLFPYPHLTSRVCTYYIPTLSFYFNFTIIFLWVIRFLCVWNMCECISYWMSKTALGMNKVSIHPSSRLSMTKCEHSWKVQLF